MKLAVALLLGALFVSGALGLAAKNKIFHGQPAQISKSEPVNPKVDASQAAPETQEQQDQRRRAAFAHKLEDHMRKMHPGVQVIADGDGSSTLHITSPVKHQAINAVLPRDPEVIKEALQLGFTRIEAHTDNEGSWTISSDLN